MTFFSLIPQTPGAVHPHGLATSHKLGRAPNTLGALAVRWSRTGSCPLSIYIGECA